MRIRFLQDVEAQDGNQNTDNAERYEKDQVVEMAQSSAEHWISRNVAVRVEDNLSRSVGGRQSPPPNPPPVSVQPPPTNMPSPTVPSGQSQSSDNSKSESTVSGATATVGGGATSTVGGAASVSATKR